MSFEVVLICDHKWRDLPGLVWLKLRLEKVRPSWRVTVIPKNLLAGYTHAFPPSVLVIPSSNGPWLRTAARFREEGALTVILPTEGRPTYGKLMEWSVASHDGCQADGILLWSEVMKDVFDRVPTPNATRAAIAGPTRFDFYRKPLCDLLPGRAELAARLGAPADRAIVAWPTTFPHAKFHGRNEAWQLRDWQKMNLGKTGMTDAVMQRMIKAEYDGREQSYACLERCARALPDVSFCLKPHPYEDFSCPEERIASWREQGIGNVHLVRGVYVWDLLNACSAHVHRTCTTGSEAWLLSKPTIELGFIESHDSVLEHGAETAGASRDAEAADDMAHSPDDVPAKLTSYLAGGGPDPALLKKREAYVRKWLYHVDGSATDRAARQICEWAEAREPARGSFWRRSGLRSRLTIRFKQAIGFPFERSLRRPLRSRIPKHDKLGHWDRMITQSDVAEWTRRLREYC